ncbi:FISUMP domain-containing protein [Dysgonomonas sp. ZJ709]|uniref:FISUMP domain-containing protein n=1 Tax=Dysgonomonas sp. ZJ709 TaxID=2709797 RepID=UPI0013E9C84C|nr:FISUMP domain-containing protein [Dysgonomonas sp. ZJ709]
MTLQKINLKLYGAFLLLIFISIIANAQVTIGSTEAPIAGALLQIKEFETTDSRSDGKSNSTKGIIMPRVELTTLTDLKADIPSVAANEELEYTGLMVFNVKENPCPTEGLYEGLYIWDGKLWQYLGEKTDEMSPDVSIGTDQDGNRFLYRSFGTTAGTWMLENLRAKRYDPLRSDEAIVTILTGPDYSPDLVKPLYGYPAEVGNTDPENSSLFISNPSLGLLYNWAAATNSKANTTTNETGNNAEGPRRQGICPYGWHLPSEKEWILLHNELQTNSSLYSKMADIGGTILLPGDNNSRLIPVGRVIKDPCEPFALVDNAYTSIQSDDRYKLNTQGYSKSKKQGGFAILLAGSSYSKDTSPTITSNGETTGYGRTASFWSNSPVDNSGAHDFVTNSESSAAYNINRNKKVYLSVRCKKNDN